MSLRLMSLLGGGFNFFLIFTPIFQTGWLNYQLDWYFPCRQPPAFPNRKPRGGRLRTSLCRCRFEVWLDAFAGSLLQRPASFSDSKKQTAAVGVFLFLLFVFVCRWLGKQPDFLLFVCCCWCFLFVVFFFRWSGKQSKNTNMFSLLGIFIYC